MCLEGGHVSGTTGAYALPTTRVMTEIPTNLHLSCKGDHRYLYSVFNATFESVVNIPGIDSCKRTKYHDHLFR
jgi:hypothetical protein